MFFDARSIGNGEVIDSDVCIVGAGVAGTTLAKEFKQANFRTCIIESGGLTPDKQTLDLNRGENIGHPYFSLHSARARFFGGTANRWNIPIGDNCVGVRLRPLDKIDFEEKEWVPYSGWPITRSHLETYYQRAQAICKIEPPSYEVDEWVNTKKTPILRFPDNKVQTVIFKFGSRLPFIEDYAKEILRATNISLYLYANVVEIVTDEAGQNVTALRCATLEGHSIDVRARLYILAAGAIETPRLLLVSNKIQKAGIGNQHDLVGRFFMEHPHFNSGFYVPSDPKVFNTNHLYTKLHFVDSVPILGKLSLSEDVIRKERLLNYVAQLQPKITKLKSVSRSFFPPIDSASTRSFMEVLSSFRYFTWPNDFSKHLNTIAAGYSDCAVSVYRKIKRTYLNTFRNKKVCFFHLVNMSEQVPNPDSRIILSEKRDRLGLRRVLLDWRLSDVDIQSAIRTQQIMHQELSKAGLGRLYIELKEDISSNRISGGWHHMGTTRMHVDSKKGVVDANCRIHGIHNLYIAGPSVFPTGGYANPSLTIIALAIRLADHIKQLMA